MADECVENTVLIAGPTASGKSRAALALAGALGGEIVNADAIQVYRDLDILSARPGPADTKAAPHHLYGFLDAAETCSAGRWARLAAAAVSAIHERGRLAIVVGGTGLYFRALTEGLSPMPEVSEAVKARAAARLEALGNEVFRAEVIARDPAMERLAAGDSQRLLRAWAVFAETGKPLSGFQSAPGKPLVAPPQARIVIEPERSVLYATADARFDAMMAAGGLDEAGRLRARGLSRDLPAMKALGAAELIAHLDGALSLEEANEIAKRNTRRFIKRQLTWFRNQAADWPRAETPEAAASALCALLGKGG